MTKEEFEYEKQLGLKEMEIKDKEVLIAELEEENKIIKGLLNEMRIALRQTKDGAKYNVSLLKDVDKLFKE